MFTRRYREKLFWCVTWILTENQLITFAPAYPPTDKVVRDHLDLAPGTTDEMGCKQYLRSFLSSLFASAHLQAQGLFPGRKKVSYACMAMVFYDFFANLSHTNDFYENVVTNARKGPYIPLWDFFKELKNYLEGRCSKWPSTPPSAPSSLLSTRSTSSTLIVE